MDEVDLLRGSAFDGLPGVVHGFTARRGGVDGALHLAGRPGLSADALRENWARALRAVHPALDVSRLALLKQVHGARVLDAGDGAGPLDVIGEADGVVTTTPGVAVAVRVADCVPVLLAGPGGVAAVHAGWRGVVASIVCRGVEALLARTGGRVDEVRAVVGPHIGVDAFEVGPEVVDGIAATGVDRAAFARRGRGDRWHADLGAAIVAQLAALGVRRATCTGGDTTDARFFSWRAEGPDTGRQAGIVAWLGDDR